MQNTVTILVGTGNAHKLAEITATLEPLTTSGREIRVVGNDFLRYAGVAVPDDVEETGTTFAENAAIKAAAFARCLCELAPRDRPEFVVADDSGLAVEVLGGAPGVWSARYAGPDATDEINNHKLLTELVDVPDEDRDAAFHCVLACAHPPADPESEPEILFTVEGRCPGRILREPHGEGGFGYDPLFFYPPLDRAFAELSGEEKNSVSHRGRALAALRRELPRYLPSS